MENSQSNFVRIIHEICQEGGIKCLSYSSDWAFCLKKNEKTSFILGYQFGLNAAVSQQIAADKSVASEILDQCGIPNVEHRCFMAPHMFRFTGGNGNWKEVMELLEKYKDLVCKDNQGTGGHLVYRVKSQRRLEEAAAEIFSKSDAMAVSPYYEIQQEYRVILLDGEVMIVFTKERMFLEGNGRDSLRILYGKYLLEHPECSEIMPSAKNFDRVLKAGERYYFQWKHNLGQGALAYVVEDTRLKEKLGELAAKTLQALGLRFASVDIICCPEGWKVLEVNSGVMMENLAGVDEGCYKMAKEIYCRAIKKMLS